MHIKKVVLGFVAAAVVSLSTTAFAQTLTYGAPIGLDIAKKIAAAAAAEAKKQNLTVVISIVDSSGTLTYLEKADGTQLASVDVAIGKARTANNFKRPTKVFEDGVSGGRNVLLSLPDALLVEGGSPIVVDNKIIGAIGVSGATSQQDGQIAEAGLASLKAK
ncbi:MAG TPA: heme-binding protein [Cellvibrio sp.]|nr:heme-binding protein [Cellvibrio sp.]